MPVFIRGIFGGGKIKDATALPEDVAAGKVFYNNDGRQVGTAQTVKTLTHTFPTPTGWTRCYFWRVFHKSQINGICNISEAEFQQSTRYEFANDIITLPGRLVYAVIDGIKYCTANVGDYSEWESQNATGLAINHETNQVRLNGVRDDIYNKPITFICI